MRVICVGNRWRGDDESGSIVTAKSVPHADDSHLRTTSSFRKCVAHEMHGS